MNPQNSGLGLGILPPPNNGESHGKEMEIEMETGVIRYLIGIWLNVSCGGYYNTLDMLECVM